MHVAVKRIFLRVRTSGKYSAKSATAVLAHRERLLLFTCKFFAEWLRVEELLSYEHLAARRALGNQGLCFLTIACSCLCNGQEGI